MTDQRQFDLQWSESLGSRQDLAVKVSLVQVNALGAAFVHVNHLGVIEAKHPENGGVEVVDMQLVLHRE